MVFDGFSIVSLLSRGTISGGNGGKGGDVILECSPAVWDFSGLQHHLVCVTIFNNK